MVGLFGCPEEVKPTKDFAIRLITIHYDDAVYQIHVDEDGDDDDGHYDNNVNHYFHDNNGDDDEENLRSIS